MRNAGVLVAGLPNSGKTTFLAALWHLVKSHDRPRKLSYGGLAGVDAAHLNAIEQRWLEAKALERTKSSQEHGLQLNLNSDVGDQLRVALADFAGESFRRVWELRRCPQPVLDAAADADSLLFLVNAERIHYPRTVYEHRRDLGENAEPPPEPVPYNPRKSPTATMVADVLQVLEEYAFQAPLRRMILGLTAWDTAQSEGKSPEALLAERLPLVSQMLASRASRTEIEVWGISAQGGSYENASAQLRDVEVPADRVIVQHGQEVGHDLTAPLAWLLG